MTKTINDVYMALFKRLRDGGEPQPSLAARELTAYACRVDKRQTAEWGHSYLDDATVDYAHLLCDRCLDGEPLAYLIGEWDFYGLTLAVDKSVLIPRADTECLCEMAIARAREKVSPRVLDLCCGSGCIGIALAHAVDDAKVAACDISDDALRLARENARRYGLQERYVAFKADVRSRPQHNLGQYDILVSNPPYITRAEMALLDKSVAGFEPALALCGGADGLDFYRAISGKWGGLLAPGGMILFECGHTQATQVASILEEDGYAGIGIADDYAGVQRIVFAYAVDAD